MSGQYAYFLCLVFLVSLSSCTYELQEPIQLRQYNSYADVRFSFYNVPDAAEYAIWSFTLMSSPDNANRECDEVDVDVYLQKDGVPVFSAVNETFPDDFLLNSSYITKILLSSKAENSRRVDMLIQAPSAGIWFAASYIQPTNQNAAIQPQGFSPKPCVHYMRTTISYNVLSYDVLTPFPVGRTQTVIADEKSAILTYFIAKHVYRYTVQVLDCTVLRPTNASCKFSITSDEHRLPSSYSSHKIDCDWDMNSTACALTVDEPNLNSWHFTSISGNESLTLQITLLISVQGCEGGATAACEVDEYYTDTSSEPYTVDFIRAVPRLTPPKIIVRDDKAYHGSFNVEVLLHSGGTLEYLLQPSPSAGSLPVNAVIYTCLTRNKFFTDIEEIKSCARKYRLTTDYSLSSQSHTYVPYPQSGMWYISIVAECYNSTRRTNNSIVDCTSTLTVYTNVTLRPCINNGCGKYGNCYMYFSGILHWSTCRCKAGYRGYGCTDDSEALSDGMQLLEALLLTLSNILFAVAGAWAIYRKWFSEALIYFFVLFASSFYHACDNGTIYVLCVLDYGVLQYCDFYGSILAVWMTAMALSELPSQLRSFLHLAGVLGILIGTQVTPSGLWNFVIPVIIAIVILATSWARLCRMDRACYPKLKVWLVQLLPGATCALVGLALYSFLETDANYFYVHSIWHLLMALAILFLLPRDKKLQCSCTSIKSQCSGLQYRQRRNEVSDEAAAGDDNQAALVDSDNSVSSI